MTTRGSRPVDSAWSSRLEAISWVVISVSAAVPAPQQLKVITGCTRWAGEEKQITKRGQTGARLLYSTRSSFFSTFSPRVIPPHSTPITAVFPLCRPKAPFAVSEPQPPYCCTQPQHSFPSQQTWGNQHPSQPTLAERKAKSKRNAKQRAARSDKRQLTF